ncbi:MAG: PorV/PorQ family protein [Elusimicrobia bacterium]|nr:PorV/PorQ family protein [Elusimicrobiota bacterium]
MSCKIEFTSKGNVRKIRSLVHIFLFLLIVSCSSVLKAGVGESAGNEILNANFSARVMGFGGACAGLADSLNSASVNPAVSAYLTNPEILTFYNQGLFKTDYAFLGFAAPLNYYQSAVTFSIAALQDEDITLNFTNPDGSFKESKTVKAGSDYLATLNYSHLLAEEISLGVNAKLLQSTLAEQYKATAYAGDIGFLIRPVGDPVCFGIAIRNFGTGLKYIEAKDDFQKEYIAGVSIRLAETNKNKILLLGDVIKDDTKKANLGCEYLFQNKFALRAGYRFGYDLDTFTAGFGVNVGGMGIDYAFVNKGDFESSQFVSVKMSFGDVSSYNAGENYFNRQMFKNAISEWSKVQESKPYYKKARDGMNAARRYMSAEKFYKSGGHFYELENYQKALEDYEKAEKSIKGYKDTQEKIQAIKNLFPQTVRKAISEAEKELASAGNMGFDVSNQKDVYLKSLEAYQRQDYKSAQEKVDLFWEISEVSYKEGAEKDVQGVENMIIRALGQGIEILDSDKRIEEMKTLFKDGKYKLAKIKADEMENFVAERTKEKLKEIEGIADKERVRKTGKNMAVSNFEARPPLSASESAFITDFFRSAMVEIDMFNIVDRNNMDKILAEQGFQQTGCTTEDCAVQMGKLLNVNYIAIGSCGKLLSRFILTVNVVDVENGKIIFSANEDCYAERGIEKMTGRIVEKIKKKFE